MKRVLGIVALFMALNASAHVYTIELLSVVGCNSIVDRERWFDELTKQYGPPKNEQGAYWFKASGEAYGARIREVFVSSIPNLSFAGIVLEAEPELVLDQVRTSRMFPTNVFPTKGYWVGADGRHIMWHKGKYTKMFCSVSWSRI